MCPSLPKLRYTLGWPSAPPPPSQPTRSVSTSMISTACAAIASILIRNRADHRRGRPTIKRGRAASLGALLGVLLAAACAPVEIPAGPAVSTPSLHESYIAA